MRLHDEFEWDPRKAEANRKKHKVTFEEAVAVLSDDQGDIYHLEGPDDEHSTEEDRNLTMGSLPTNRRVLLVISWTDRSTARKRITRIISARLAQPHERRRYDQEIGTW